MGVCSKRWFRTKKYPWGDEILVNGSIQCNIFDGEFPYKNTAPKEMRFTTKVNEFNPNNFGLFNMVGMSGNGLRTGSLDIMI